jgi:hypothetical protein
MDIKKNPFAGEETVACYVRLPVSVAAKAKVLAEHFYVKPSSIYRRWLIEKFLEEFPKYLEDEEDGEGLRGCDGSDDQDNIHPHY